MTNIASAIVRQRARSVISRYLHQRGEPKDNCAPVISGGVQSPASATAVDRPRTSPSSAAHSSSTPPQSSGANASSARVRFPPLPDDFDVQSLDVFDLLDYLSELSFSRELKLTTARCYRRWLAAYLEDEEHPDAMRVRNWVIPHSPDYYEMLLMAADDLENEKQIAATIEQSKAQESQLDMFASPTDSTAPADGSGDNSQSEALTPFTREEVLQMMFEARQAQESVPVAEYDYVSSDVTDILIERLQSSTASGKPRYKHGVLAAALFTGTIMLGLRPREWQHATYHETYTDTFSLLSLGPVVEVHTLKQQRRRDDNPLREKRLLVLDKFHDSELAFAKGLLRNVHVFDTAASYDKMLNNVRMTLNNVWKRLVKEKLIKPTQQINKSYRDGRAGGDRSSGYGVNLYTARHIFAEEVKRSGLYTRFELAAMIGHTTTVNQRYYTLGDKFILKTYDHTLPRPWPGDAQDIEQWCDDVVSALSKEDIDRLRHESGIYYPPSGKQSDIDRADSLEDFFNR